MEHTHTHTHIHTHTHTHRIDVILNAEKYVHIYTVYMCTNVTNSMNHHAHTPTQ